MSAQNSRRRFAYVAETVFGTTPATPSTQQFEANAYEATLNTEQLNSNNINPHRQITFSRRGNVGVEGTLSVELAPDNYDWVLENLFRSTFTGNVLKVGNTQSSFSIEEGFMDIGQYQVVTGARFNTMSLTLNPNELIRAEFGFMGAGAGALTGTSIDAAPEPVVAKPSFFHEGGSISEGGSPVAFITGMTVSITNGMAGNYAFGNTSYRSFSDGKFLVSGEVTALFESAALYNKFRNGTSSSLAATLVAGAETLAITIPDVRFTGGNFDRDAEGPVLVTLQYTGVYDATSQTTISITRSA